MIPWKYKGKIVDSPPEESHGFLYCITTDNGLKYFGKKILSFTKRKLLSAKRKKELGTRKKYEYVSSDSGWLSYCGSCIPLKQYIAEHGDDCVVKREIIDFAYSKMDLTFGELCLLIKERVLFRDDVWNRNVASKFFKDKIKEII